MLVPDRTTCLRQADDWYASFVLSFYTNQGNFYLLLHFREHHPMHLLSSSSTWISLECTTTWQKTRAVLVEMRFNDAMDICIALQSCFVVLNSKWTTDLGMPNAATEKEGKIQKGLMLPKNPRHFKLATGGILSSFYFQAILSCKCIRIHMSADAQHMRARAIYSYQRRCRLP